MLDALVGHPGLAVVVETAAIVDRAQTVTAKGAYKLRRVSPKALSLSEKVIRVRAKTMNIPQMLPERV